MKKSRTLVILKPDAIQRSLVGEIIKRFERTGLKIVGAKFTVADEETLQKHYHKDDEWFETTGNRIIEKLKSEGKTPEKDAIEYGKDIIRALIKYMQAGPVVVLCLEGASAVEITKKLVGSTEPLTSDIGTIRGDLTIDSYNLANMDGRAVRNLIHCSGTQEEADYEISLWFKPDEIINYTHLNEKILYDVNLDGILE